MRFPIQKLLVFCIPLILVLPTQAEAALTYVGGVSGSGTGATYNISLTSLTGGSGSTALEGDIVVVITGWASTANGNPGVTTAGYTEEPGSTDLYSNDTRDANVSANWKIMGSTPDTSVTVSGFNNAANGGGTVVQVWRGVDQTTPMDATVTTTSASNQSASSPDSPSITPVTSGAYVISAGLGTDDTTPLTKTAPSGYSNAVAVTGTGSTMSVTVGIASKAWSSGAENPAAWTGGETSTSDSWAAFTIALRPAFAPTVTTQAESSVTQTTVTVNGNITSTKGISPTIRGFAWGTNANLSGGDTATTTENGTFSAGAFTGSLSSLTCNTTYYSRPYATNSIGTGLGTIDSFTTSSCVSTPTVTTNFAGSINFNSANLVGSITATGGADATQNGFAYGTDSTLATVIATTTLGGFTGTGAFNGGIGGLSNDITYYFRAYATNTGGTGYGSIISFVTGNSTPSRKIRLLEGFSIKFFNGKIVLFGN